LEGLLADVMEVLLELVIDNLLEDLDVDRLDVLLVEMPRSLLDNLSVELAVVLLGTWSSPAVEAGNSDVVLLDLLLKNWLLLGKLAGLSLDELVDLLTDRKLVTVLLEGLIVRDILASLLLETELDGLLLDVRLLVANWLEGEIVERLLIGRLDVFDEDRDTPLSRTELIEVLLGPIEVEVFAVTVTITVRVTNFRGGVNVATAMRLDLIVVVRRAVELTILVET
jgi:hypothetical protein